MSKTTAKRRTDLDLLRHIWKNVSRDNETGCWEWLRSVDVRGYGQIFARTLNESRPIKTHRAIWMLFYGEVPAGMHLHHTCENPVCCNPDHLELLTPAAHLDKHRDPDYCVRGHFFDEANTAYHVKGAFKSRVCRKCDAERKQRSRAAQAQSKTMAFPCVWCGKVVIRAHASRRVKPAECKSCFHAHAVKNPNGKGVISGARVLAEVAA